MLLKIVACLALSIVVVSAQEAKAPTLDQVTAQQVRIALLQMELAQVRAQMAQMDFEQEREGVIALLQKLKVDGYRLDLQSLTYMPTTVEQETKTTK